MYPPKQCVPRSLQRALCHVAVRVKETRSTSIWALRDAYVQGPWTITGGRERIVAILSRAKSRKLGSACCLVRYVIDDDYAQGAKSIVSWESEKSFLVKHVADLIRTIMQELGFQRLQEEGLACRD